jgi:hypothetical protein
MVSKRSTDGNDLETKYCRVQRNGGRLGRPMARSGRTGLNGPWNSAFSIFLPVIIGFPFTLNGN